jgi:hypothetical protein
VYNILEKLFKILVGKRCGKKIWEKDMEKK